MQFYTVKWTGDGQIIVESDDGVILHGAPIQIVSELKAGSLRKRLQARMATAGGIQLE